MDTPLIQLTAIERDFPSGGSLVHILKNINLSIYTGELVAIVGTSGSGKSTLMNILGCLDKPSRGKYVINGRCTDQLSADELAELRREYFGFIFQRYHLLNELTAAGNVEIPAIYAGISAEKRKKRAEQLLAQLGLNTKMANKPTQLSGGQQQRVSIARALMNGGQIILADEPTGALDKRSGEEVMAILRDLHQKGHTIVLVTHDPKIAESAERIIEISDGHIIADRAVVPKKGVSHKKSAFQHPTAPTSNWRGYYDRFRDAFKMARLSMAAQKLRTFLTMLGIIIGITSVVSVVALGKGTQTKILDEISGMGTSTLEIFAGSGFGDRNANRVTTLKTSDATILSKQSYIHSATPNISVPLDLRSSKEALTGTVNGVSDQFFEVRGYTLKAGHYFNTEDIERSAQYAVIDTNTATRLFPNEKVLGQTLWAGTLPVKVIGVAERNQQGFGSNENLNVWLPYTTVLYRITGPAPLRSITVRVKDDVDMGVAETAVTALLKQRHGMQDFFVFNTDSIRQSIESTTAAMTLLISLIAVISLVVGGIGVMNIMLVSVTERTREIGVRMAVGARSSDILQQFLIEAIWVCLIGGAIGVGLALAIGLVFDHAVSLFRMQFSFFSIVAAFFSSSLIGILFGFFPARRAARLDPIHALERE